MKQLFFVLLLVVVVVVVVVVVLLLLLLLLLLMCSLPSFGPLSTGLPSALEACCGAEDGVAEECCFVSALPQRIIAASASPPCGAPAALRPATLPPLPQLPAGAPPGPAPPPRATAAQDACCQRQVSVKTSRATAAFPRYCASAPLLGV